MRPLTPLERLFAEEFCRFAGVRAAALDELRVIQCRANPAGFVSELVADTVPDMFRWPARLFDTPRIALVGEGRTRMHMLLVFDGSGGKLRSIEGDAPGFDWSQAHEPAFWSETERTLDMRKLN